MPLMLPDEMTPAIREALGVMNFETGPEMSDARVSVRPTVAQSARGFAAYCRSSAFQLDEDAEMIAKEFDVLAIHTEREEKALEQVVDERDEAQEAISQAYYLVIGRSPEWSNLFGYEQALEEIKDACSVLRQSLKLATAK